MRALYSLALWAAQPLLRRKLARRGVQEPGYLVAPEERFGHYATQPWPAHDLTLWVHAVSLGETRTAALLITALRARLPGMRLLLTHGTATGRAEGAKLLQPGDVQVWQPWDTPQAVQRFLTHFKPRLGVLMETEIWPNLVAGCQQQGVPLVLANARMSEKSRQQAARLGWLSRPAFGALSAVWAQTEADAQRLRQLGATVQGVLGNLKFDAAPDPAQLAQGRHWRQRVARPVALFASSREGEETTWLKSLASNRHLARMDEGQAAINSGVVEPQWMIVPRHPQRFEAVAALIEQHGFRVSRRSQWPDGPPPGDGRATIWLGDSLGEMALYYGLADVALLGGSFEPLGGQNLIEAAACACPVVMGPHTFNFAQAAELAQEAGAARRVDGMAQAVSSALDLLAAPDEQHAMAQAAQSLSTRHRGAVAQTVAALVALLDEQGVHRL